MNGPTGAADDIQQAYRGYTQAAGLRNSKVACALVIALMPAGVFLDHFVYPHQVGFFFQLRLLCSLVVAGVLWGLSRAQLSDLTKRILSIGWYLLPAFSISWMIASTDGPLSSYYAGLCLVILAVSSVTQATVAESIVAIALILAMYLTACLLNGSFGDGRMFVNNLYFLILTAMIVVTGNYFFNRLRRREFVLRFELDHNRREIEENNRKLVELDRVKSRFFANVSHELRTPLTLLLAPMEALLSQGRATDAAEQRELLATMQANGMRLLKMINDLLDLVRIESGHVELKKDPIVIDDFLRGLINAVRKTAENRAVRLNLSVAEELGTVIADGDKLEKILLNLLFNALKFTPAGGRIDLTALRQNHQLVFHVRDTGVGIDEHKLPFVFDRFWQADTSSQRQYQGVGIGLALVKELVEVQGGTVAVTSRIHEGSEFTVALPYSAADKTAPAGAAAGTVLAAGTESNEQHNGTTHTVEDQWINDLYRRAEHFPSLSPLRRSTDAEELSGRSGKPRLLIADDEPDMRRFLHSQLTRHFEVVEADDGQQAIDKACQFLPDIILTDMMMPRKDGIEVCRELRERTSTQAIPIVLLTAWGEEDAKLRALAAGASDFLTKPFSTTELHVRLKNLVENHRGQKLLARQKQILEATLEELKETESQLIHSEKMASLGRMSAGIIHEINNPLNFAKTGLYTLRRFGESLPDGERQDFAEIREDIENGLDRMQKITADLNRFAHPNMEQFENVTVESLVRTALRLVSNQWRDQVSIIQQIDKSEQIWGNAIQITQVIVNLLQNALQAVQKKSFFDDQPTVWIKTIRHDGESVIVIRDNGLGIAAEHLDKIFDPFFTTKDVGEGVGLGLSICHRIMEQHRGRISVTSEIGQYTEFGLAFPPVPSVETAPKQESWRGNEQHL